MHISVAHSDLYAAFRVANSVVATRSPVPIVQSVLIVTGTDGTIRLCGTDMISSIEVTIPATITHPGGIALPADRLGPLLAGDPSMLVNIETLTKGRAHLTLGRAVARLNGYPEDEFPANLGPPHEIEWLDVPSIELSQVLRSVYRSAAHDTTRPVLSGICLTAEMDGLVAVAADGFRLSIRKTSSGASQSGWSVIVERGIIPSMLSIIDAKGVPASVSLGLHPRGCWLTAGNVSLFTRAIEGKFPNWRQLAPTPDRVDAKLRFDRKALAAAIRLAGSVTHGTLMAKDPENKNAPSKSAWVRLAWREGEVYVEAVGLDVGECSVPIAVELLNEVIPPVESFNATYLLDAISVIEDEAVIIAIPGNHGPSVVYPASGDGYGHVHVLMPMFINDDRSSLNRPVSATAAATA